jgi:hypothetical protein
MIRQLLVLLEMGASQKILVLCVVVITAGMNSNQWQSASNYRAADAGGYGSGTMPGAGGMDASRSSYAGGSTGGGNQYLGQTGGQQYKWY